MIKELKGVYLECETIKDRKNVKCFKNINAGIAYGFPKLEGKVREMKAANQSNDIKKILFREDTAQISFDNTNLKELIKDNLISYYNKMDDEFEKEYKIDDLNKSNNLVDKISDFIITNRSGYLGRILEISIYLDFIVEFIKENECNLSECEKESLKILANYADRSKILEECINEATIGDFEKFSFDYDGIEVDLLKSFRGENVFEFLPIVGTKDTPELIIRNKEKELGIENYKMSLKLNGVVARSKKPSLEYNIWEINQHISKESYRNYEKNEIGIDLRNALLLEFFLINLADSNYDALEKFNNRVIRYKEDRILENRAGITTELKDIMSNIEMNLPEINKNITSIKTLIKNQFFNSCKSFERTYKKYFTIPTSALDVFESDSARNDLYKKYSILTNEPLPSEYCIHSYAYEIKLFSSVETIDDS
jgi:hypothetical protein